MIILMITYKAIDVLMSFLMGLFLQIKILNLLVFIEMKIHRVIMEHLH